ncbi:hybrid sensor histidine kinase/response regulator [Undibacterium sp. SXout7W]|uniref:hybrid sensor histidine kinase/response regulator n=1 Tax=Undibacterium sp. SXout7W TaxID=3413049 RepID=UPI003BF02538
MTPSLTFRRATAFLSAVYWSLLSIVQSCLLLFTFLFVLLLPLSVHAQTLELHQDDQRLSLAGQMALAQTTIKMGDVSADIAKLSFHIIPENLNAGFGDSVLWLKFSLHVRERGAGGTWWLEVPPSYINELSLYQQTATGLRLLGQAGTEIAFSQRQIAFRNAVFAIDLPDQPGTHSFVLKIVSQTSRSAQPVLWRPAAFVSAVQADNLAQGIFFGGIGIVVISSLFFSVWLKERSYLLYAVYAGTSGILQFFAQGFAKQWWIPEQLSLQNILMGSLMCIVIGLGAETLRFIRIDAYFPILTRRYRWLAWAISLLLLPFALDGQYRVVAPSAQLSYIFQALISTGLAIAVWRKGEQAGKYYLMAFMSHNIAVVMFLPRNLGWLPVNFWTVNSMQISTFIHMVLMHLAVARHIREMRSVAEAQKTAMLNDIRISAAELDKKVIERTAEMHQAVLKADEANRAKSEFLARVSHDLRSPLTSILGYAQLLQSNGGKTASQARIIRRSASHMLHVINDLIEYARGYSSNQLEPAPVYIYGVLDAIVQEAKILTEKNHNRFLLDIRNELPTVLIIDSKRLRQVLINLLQNSAKFTKKGLIELLITCQEDSAHPRQIILSFNVRDTGCGISEENHKNVFTPFFRVNKTTQSEGTGLGLPIVETWVHRMGGDITLRSSINTGTEIQIQIPVAVGSEHDMSHPQILDMNDYLTELDAGGRRIWVIEDTEEIRELLIEVLLRMGFDVESAADGLEFIDKMKHTETVPPSLVLTDYLMPGANGDAVLNAVRQYWPGVPVVLLSATQRTMESESSQNQFTSGFDASLMKPINLSTLRHTLNDLLNISTNEVDEAILAPPIKLPPSTAIDQMRQLLAMGALTDLAEWATQLTAEHPQCEAFARQLIEFAEEGDLDAIQNMCEIAGVDEVQGNN